jgi:hypothetical protein
LLARATLKGLHMSASFILRFNPFRVDDTCSSSVPGCAASAATLGFGI